MGGGVGDNTQGLGSNGQGWAWDLALGAGALIPSTVDASVRSEEMRAPASSNSSSVKTRRAEGLRCCGSCQPVRPAALGRICSGTARLGDLGDRDLVARSTVPKACQGPIPTRAA